jgi:hypothetical protein
MQVIERTEEHYDVREVEFGKVYGWCPGRLVIECDCGERPTLAASATTCQGCGADHAAVVGRELATRRLKDEQLHPWRYSGDREEDEILY